MQSTMMDDQLNVWDLLERQASPTREVVSRLHTGEVRRYTYADLLRRASRLGAALGAYGIRTGDRVATLAWNHYRHLEAYFGIPGAGAVLHTVNPRLHPPQIAYILNHAEARILLVDPLLLPLVEGIHAQLRTIELYVVFDERVERTAVKPVASYEDFLARGDRDFEPVRGDERDAAAMAYTTGTTGEPKGVVYSHRALVLHSLSNALQGAAGLSEQDVILPVVPMFHVNAWCLPFSATMVGAKQVLPGHRLDPASLVELLEKERVTVSAGVPTVWMALIDYLEKADLRLPDLRKLIIGGSAAPQALIERFERRGIPVRQGYGMTETSPVLLMNTVRPHLAGLPAEARHRLGAKQGLPIPLVRVRVADAEGRPVPEDGATMGELQVRGPWVTRAYYCNPEATREAITPDGWLRTGDIVTRDGEGYIEIADRSKDLVKSGGEWISSVALENALMGHPAVKEAAVIAVPHPKWQERPFAVVVLHAGAQATVEDLREFLAPRFPRWWLPDDVAFVEAIPRTSAGKFLKTALRETFRKRFAPES